jgi:organic radical activating enzyme
MVNADSSKYKNIAQSDYEAVAGPDWPAYCDFLLAKNIPEFVYQEIGVMLLGATPFDNPAFCILPFYATEHPFAVPCCIMKQPFDLPQVQAQMLDGTRPEVCGKCWQLEDNGIKSDRQLKNETLDFYFKKDISSIFDDCVKKENIVNHYKIDTSNVCNGTCVTCNSNASSSWAQLNRKNNQPFTPLWQTTESEVDKIIDYTTAVAISFRGGEPFLSDTNFYILEQLIKNNNSSCFISFITNGSTELTDYQKNTISKFKNVNFCFSIDGVGPVYEYIRYPLKWHTLNKNIAYCRDNNIEISVSYTISNLNIMYHEQTVQWFKHNKLPFLHNPVVEPAHFRPGALPKNIKEKILSTTTDNTIHSLLKYHTDHDDVDHAQFLREIAKQDSWKKIQIDNHLPEFAKLISDHSLIKIPKDVALQHK